MWCKENAASGTGGAADITGIILASGESRRFGGANKLLALVEGVPIVARSAIAYIDAGLAPVLVVVGHEADRIGAALADLGVRLVVNPYYEQGQSRALSHGIAAVPRVADAAIIGVADQPFLTPDLIRALVDRYERDRPSIVAPRFDGRPGNPVLFDRSLFEELLQVQGDQGGRGVVRDHGGAVAWIDAVDPLIGRDIDTLEDLHDATSTES